MDHQPGATHEALPVDPENDIDAKSATIWFIAGTIGLFAVLWVLVPIFVQVLDFEQNIKINQSVTQELNDLKAKQAIFLGGDNPTKKSIDDVVKSLRR